MRLLILTQELNKDGDVLGFFHSWAREFARRCEKVTVICLKKGRIELPDNVKVLSLGKEEGESRWKYVYRFYKYIWQERNEYDKVFVHMNQIYVLLGGMFWAMWGKKVGLWYAHGHVPLALRLAEKQVDVIFSSTKSGCRLRSKKIEIVGQGVDCELFNSDLSGLEKDKFNVVAVGRISKVKDFGTLIRAVGLLVEDGVVDKKKVGLKIIGGAESDDQKKYLDELNDLVSKCQLKDVVDFVGSVPNREVVKYLKKADLFVNTSYTGSLDKVILEAMACRVLILSCNESLNEVLGDLRSELMFKKGDEGELFNDIKKVYLMSKERRAELGERLRNIVERDHGLIGLVKRIVDRM